MQDADLRGARCCIWFGAIPHMRTGWENSLRAALQKGLGGCAWRREGSLTEGDLIAAFQYLKGSCKSNGEGLITWVGNVRMRGMVLN